MATEPFYQLTSHNSDLSIKNTISSLLVRGQNIIRCSNTGLFYFTNNQTLMVYDDTTNTISEKFNLYCYPMTLNLNADSSKIYMIVDSGDIFIREVDMTTGDYIDTVITGFYYSEYITRNSLIDGVEYLYFLVSDNITHDVKLVKFNIITKSYNMSDSIINTGKLTMDDKNIYITNAEYIE